MTYSSHFTEKSARKEKPVIFFCLERKTRYFLPRKMASSINARVYLHAGSHLAATLHGQNIVWDDDVDMWIDSKKKEAFLDACSRYGSNMPILKQPQRVELHCIVGHNAIKVWLQPPGMKKETTSWAKHFSPFVDLFLFEIREGVIIELLPDAKKRSHVKFKVSEFFPTRPFYFGGIHLIGPPAHLSKMRYTHQNCVLSSYNHRLEFGLPAKINFCLDCHKLYAKFPFVHPLPQIRRGEAIQVGGTWFRVCLQCSCRSAHPQWEPRPPYRYR